MKDEKLTRIDDVFNLIKQELKELQEINERIVKKLSEHVDERKLKGNEIVGSLGELYAKSFFDGQITKEDTLEYDVIADDKKISVKTRRKTDTSNSWVRTSHISSNQITENSPTHLLFVQLKDNYEVNRMWLYPWNEELMSRFKRVGGEKGMPLNNDEIPNKSFTEKTDIRKNDEKIAKNRYYFVVKPNIDIRFLKYSKKDGYIET